MKSTMTLGEFLSKHRIPKAAFARQVGVSRQSVVMWLRGVWLPNLEHRAIIAHITEGSVPASIWGER